MVERESLIVSTGDVEICIAPHHSLECLAGHGPVLMMDADYVQRCQEWLLRDATLVEITGGTTCSCVDSPTAETRLVTREEVVDHRYKRTGYKSTVRFTYPLVTCARCMQHRDITADFVRAWDRMQELAGS